MHYVLINDGGCFTQNCFIKQNPIVKLSNIPMKTSPKIHHRHSIRMKGYDYSLPGAYFVALVTRERMHLFGEISNGVMHRNQIGEITCSVWEHLPDSFSIQLDEWVIMPNHLHGIICIEDTNKGEASANESSGKSLYASADASPLHAGTQQGSLGAIIQNFKSISTRKIHQYLCRGEAFASNQSNTKSTMMANASPNYIWQRNYYDRIIRDEKEWI